jgi:molybdate transport system ATP-binding protein
MITLNIHKALLTSSGDITLSANISIPQGETVAFYGASGSGKTTLLRIIAGLTQPDGGKINVGGSTWLDAEKGKNLPPNKRPVGFVFQDYALFPNMTVKENIQFAQEGKDSQQVQWLLDMLGLAPLQNRNPAMLSGGQQQRVALARAIARKPRLLLLDEPLSALDHQTRSELQDEIKQLNAQLGITTVVVSHDMAEIFKLCTRVYAFDHGKVIDKGCPADVFLNSPISSKVQFMGEVLHAKNEDIIKVLTLLVGNTPVKVAVSNTLENYAPGDKVLIASKAFNPIIQKIQD